MPRRNVLKIDVPDSYYHVYARGVGKQPIFMDHADFQFFLGLWERYLSKQEILDASGNPYDKLYDSIEALCYCLMGNHFHMLLYQHQAGGMQRLMRGVMTAYSRYFNRKYNRSGPLFESRYKASRISSPSYLEHITRYIHLNPKDWRLYPYSSISYYIDGNRSDWLHPERILALFDSPEQYATFVSDYEAAQRELDTLKHELADTGYS
jgi:putative transposase